MQNWKIKKMSYQELIGQLQAVRSILYYYQRGKDFPGACQLCKVSRTYHPRASPACKNCLWIIMEGERCTKFCDRNFNERCYMRELTGRPAWHKLRIPMLRRWAKVAQAEMDRRTCGGGENAK